MCRLFVLSLLVRCPQINPDPGIHVRLVKVFEQAVNSLKQIVNKSCLPDCLMRTKGYFY
jgi:hypothetical protein